MEPKFRLVLAACAGIAVLSAVSMVAIAEEKVSGSLKQQLVGTWLLVSAENITEDGVKSQPFGPNPQGVLMLDSGGRFVGLNRAGSLPKFMSDSRMSGTIIENQTIIRGSLASFGTYTVNETEKIISQHYDGSTFANWDGTDQKRSIRAISADEFTYTTNEFVPSYPGSGRKASSMVLTYKRAM